MEEELNSGPSFEQAKDAGLDTSNPPKLPAEKSFLTGTEDDERDEKEETSVQLFKGASIDKKAKLTAMLSQLESEN